LPTRIWIFRALFLVRGTFYPAADVGRLGRVRAFCLIGEKAIEKIQASARQATFKAFQELDRAGLVSIIANSFRIRSRLSYILGNASRPF